MWPERPVGAKAAKPEEADADEASKADTPLAHDAGTGTPCAGPLRQHVKADEAKADEASKEADETDVDQATAAAKKLARKATCAKAGKP